VREVCPSQVRVPECDQSRHYSANPFDLPSGTGGSGEGPFTV
jgi:hypothetical protein